MAATRFRWHTFFPLALPFLTVALVFWRPELTDNEVVRFVQPIRLVDPGFLSGDWGYHKPELSSFFYDWSIALMLRMATPLHLAIIVRPILWLVLIWQIVRLFESVGVRRIAISIALTLFILTDQNIFAAEHLFDGLEPKALAYPLWIFSLRCCWLGRILAGSMSLGLATVIHPFLGAWGGVTWIVLAMSAGTFRSVRSLLPWTIALGVHLLLYLKSLAPGAVEQAADFENYLYVHFRNTHHLSPSHFLTPGGLLIYLSLGICVLLMRDRTLPLKQRDAQLALYLGPLFGLILGLVANAISFDFLLKTYPFRLASSFGYLVALCVAASALRRTERRIQAFAAASLIATVIYQSPIVARVATTPFTTARLWLQYGAGIPPRYHGLADWLSRNTVASEVILFPPAEIQLFFWVNRPQLVSFKYHPPHDMAAWYARLVDLNGGRLPRYAGFELWPQLTASFRRLSKKQLSSLSARYGVRYYVLAECRADLPVSYQDPFYCVHSIGRPSGPLLH